MKKILPLLLLTITFFASHGQQLIFDAKPATRKGKPIVCSVNHQGNNTIIDLPEHLKEFREQVKHARTTAAGKSAKINIEYVGFTPQAQESFQRALDTWANLLKSDVAINVVAFYRPLGPGVLGSASSTDFNSNFPGALKSNVWYPIPLAEKISGRELNSEFDADIQCNFSNEIDWYFGRINPAQGQYDFETIVLHELCHGLGFIGSMSVNDDNTIGSYGYGSSYPFLFDTYAETGVGKTLTDTLNFKNDSRELRTALISDDLFLNAPKTVAENGNERPKLYVPNRWEPGSSFSHLDDDTYPIGSLNALMSPKAGQREKVATPGPIVLNFFNEMGWDRTAIVHDRVKDRTDTEDVVVKTKILSDTTLIPSSAVLVYSYGEVVDSSIVFRDTVAVQLQKVPNSADEYQATIPVNKKAQTIAYYMSVKDALGRVVNAPAPPYQFYAFSTGEKDETGPAIDYYGPNFVSANRSFDLIANVDDAFAGGVASVVMKYRKNGSAETTVPLVKYDKNVHDPFLSQGYADINAYIAQNPFGNLEINDRVTYQIEATDKSGNKTLIPTRNEGNSDKSPDVLTSYELVATSILENADSYANDFDSPTDDFSLLGFEISKPNGFVNGNLNTKGGYPNGKGYLSADRSNYVRFEDNQIAFLRKPIVLSSDTKNATITFDEIVLVEPGSENTVYGDAEFWDYVVVEGSLDGGSWYPIFDGYDSRANSAWLNRFGTSFVSTGKGDAALFKKRTVNIYDGIFKDVDPGTPILIRFRLFSDQWVRGWGWAIDNLYIQKEAPKPLATETTEDNFIIGPNPTSDKLTVRYEFKQPQSLKIEVMDIRGRKVFTDKLTNPVQKLTYELNVENYPTGTYFLRLSSDEGYRTKKFIVTK